MSITIQEHKLWKGETWFDVIDTSKTTSRGQPSIVRSVQSRKLAETIAEAQARTWQTKVTCGFDEYDNDRQIQLIRRYPNLIAHIICRSLGYATPRVAANILWNAIHDKPEWCEWVDACYNHDARKPILEAIEGRHRHRGYMAHFPQARAIVQREIEDRQPPFFGLGSWF